MRLEGKISLITGAANAFLGKSMGFGGATAHLFCREGSKVIISDVNDDLGESAALKMRDSGFDVTYAHLDVTSESEWKTAINLITSKYGKLDVLVNNAGTCITKKFEDFTEADWIKDMDVNAKGVFLGTKNVLPAMLSGGGGSIINISSISGIVGSPNVPVYSAAKGAVRIFSKSIALQYAKQNIRVNSVHPGFANTQMTKVEFESFSVLRDLEEKIPMGRLCDIKDVAFGILYLASDESSYVTGVELVIDGGFTAQ